MVSAGASTVEQSRAWTFVTTDSKGKPRSADRWLIRSSCMHGRTKTAPKAKPAKRPADELEFQYIEFDRDGTGPLALSNRGRRKAAARSTKQATALASASDAASDSSGDPDGSCLSTMSPIAFSEVFRGESGHYLYKFLTRSGDTWFPADLSIDLDVDRGLCFPWLAQDRAYLHSMLFAASGLHDFYTHHAMSELSLYHAGKAIGYIHQYMAETGGRLRDSTISAIISLVLLSSNFVDYPSAEVHAAGLRRIVKLRGGLESFRGNPKLLIKLSRVDFAYYLHTGQKPLFFADPRTISYFPSPQFSGGWDQVNPSRVPPAIRALTDEPSLLALFQDMHSFSLQLRSVHGAKDKLPQDEFQNKVCVLQLRLLNLQGKMRSILAECVRLTMLAFLTTTFQIPFAAVRFPHLARQFRIACSAIEVRDGDGPAQDLMLWFLMIGAISLFGIADEWIRERWMDVIPHRLGWNEASETLGGFPWVEAVHGKLGKSAFDVLHYGIVLDMSDEEAVEGLCASGWAICPMSV